MLILVANELNIPTQATDLPLKFKKLLQPNKLDGVIILGEMKDKMTLDYFRTLCDKVIIGASGSAIMLDRFKVGLVCDTQTQSYSLAARRLDVDMLLIAGPKSFEAYERDSVFYCSPGSMTGTYSSLEDIDHTPSFILLDIQAAQVTTFVYKLQDDEIRVDKIEYSKLQPKDNGSNVSSQKSPAPAQEPTPEPEEVVQEDHSQEAADSQQQVEVEAEVEAEVETETPAQSPAQPDASSYQVPPIADETENLWDQ